MLPMPKNISIININAPVERVWDALTKPELVKQWQYGSELITSWQVGSPIRFRTEWEGSVFEQWGKVVEFCPNELIKYTLFAPGPGITDSPENYFIMSYILTGEQGNIKLEIIQEDNRPGAIPEEPQAGENPVLLSLKTLVESISA